MATILVVDDNPSIARMLGRLLEIKGYRAVVAHSGAEALAAAQEQLPDLILMDLTMPEMDGLEVMRRLQDHHSAGPDPVPEVIFFSAVDDPAVIESAMRQGACDYWVKASFKFEELHRRIALHLPTGP